MPDAPTASAHRPLGIWRVAILAKHGKPIADFIFADEAGAHAFWVDMKTTGRFTKPAAFLVVHDPGNVCRYAYAITDFFQPAPFPQAL